MAAGPTEVKWASVPEESGLVQTNLPAGSDDELPQAPLTVQVAAQARAERLVGDLGMDETSEEAFRIHEAAARDPRIADDLGHEAKGRFHEMSRGSMIELRSDMESGANLPGDMGRFIRLSAERIERVEAPVVKKEAVRMPGVHGEQGMGI